MKRLDLIVLIVVGFTLSMAGIAANVYFALSEPPPRQVIRTEQARCICPCGPTCKCCKCAERVYESYEDVTDK